MRIFDVHLRSQITAFSTPFYNIVLIVFSGGKNQIAIVGNEDQVKESIYLFNLNEIETSKKP